MSIKRNRDHIIVRFKPSVERYQKPPRKIEEEAPPAPANRTEHGKQLFEHFSNAINESRNAQTRTDIVLSGSPPGIRVRFEGPPGVPLKIESLGNAPKGIEVLSVKRRVLTDGTSFVESAVVFIPNGKESHFLKYFQDYIHQRTKKGKRKNQALVDTIDNVRRATLKALWTDTPELFPELGQPIWWEVWLRNDDGDELVRLYEYAEFTGLVVRDRRIHFPDRTIVLVYGTIEQMAGSADVFNDLAEVQRARETATSFLDDQEAQKEWVLDLHERLIPAPENSPTVCVLDTGINEGHGLLSSSLSLEDKHTLDPEWGTSDHAGHGTEMAGLALFGDTLASLLERSEDVHLFHRLESVKILPPPQHEANQPDLYGAITAEAVGRPEVQAPLRLKNRVFSMAVTAKSGRDRGKPTSWSASIDAIVAGRSFDPTDKGLKYIDDGSDIFSRLFLVCAGNLDNANLARDHLDRSDLESVHDPAQAWNALTVGAYTDKAVITDTSWKEWFPVAHPGDLSPWSTTSLVFEPQWPIKPEVVFEGGNIVANSSGEVDWPCDDLCLLTTFHKPTKKQFVSTWATSAAVAQAARFCAIILSQYPEFNAETVRALLVHSSRWTPQMLKYFNKDSRKSHRERMLRRYGYGVPNLERALQSASNAVTLIIEDKIRPFINGKMGDVHIHELPWPKEVLHSLGKTPIVLRVTLSYFIEPSPGNRGWRHKFRYQSHGLRFVVNNPSETRDDFRGRINKLSREAPSEVVSTSSLDDPHPTAESSFSTDNGKKSIDWFLGVTARDRGSIHSDYTTNTTGAELASQNLIAIFPVSGWWKDLKNRDRSEKGSRYSLIVTLETEESNADLWTPIAAQIESPSTVER